MSPALFRTLVSLSAACVLGGCASSSTRVESYRLPLSPQGLVLVVDGAGGTHDAANAVTTAVEQTQAPLYVRSFEWTHGANRGLADMTDVPYAREQGRLLAGNISWYRTAYPNMPITIVAYSAGTHVALESTKYMEPNTVEEIVLLAPAVSADYDLRRALRASRRGIDAFTSHEDRFFLGMGTRLIGTADGKQGMPPAGRVGFDVPELPGSEAYLAQKLRQHPWDSSATWSDNYGEHSGTLKPAYFRAYVLPLLTTR